MIDLEYIYISKVGLHRFLYYKKTFVPIYIEIGSILKKWRCLVDGRKLSVISETRNEITKTSNKRGMQNMCLTRSWLTGKNCTNIFFL